MKLNFLSFIPAVAWFILIYILLTLPGSDIPQDPFLEMIHFDKWVHIGLFSGLVFLFCRPLRKQFVYKHSVYVLIILLAIVYGIAMEYVQEYFTEGRSSDITDMLADSIGCLIGYWGFRVMEVRVAKKISPCRNRGRNQN